MNSIFIMNHIWLCQIWARFTKSLWSANHRKMKLKLCRWKSLKHVMPYFAHQLTSQNGTCAQNFLSYLKRVSYFCILFLMSHNIMYFFCNLRRIRHRILISTFLSLKLIDFDFRYVTKTDILSRNMMTLLSIIIWCVSYHICIV